jgi:hypothetical protein
MAQNDLALSYRRVSLNRRSNMTARSQNPINGNDVQQHHYRFEISFSVELSNEKYALNVLIGG